MQLGVVFQTLLLYVVRNHSDVTILPYGVCIVAHGPEVSAPQKPLYLRMVFKYFLGNDTFDYFDNI